MWDQRGGLSAPLWVRMGVHSDGSDCGPITSWQMDGETVETVTDFIFLGSKITSDDDYSHEIKRGSSLEEKL